MRGGAPSVLTQLAVLESPVLTQLASLEAVARARAVAAVLLSSAAPAAAAPAAAAPPPPPSEEFLRDAWERMALAIASGEAALVALDLPFQQRLGFLQGLERQLPDVPVMQARASQSQH